MNAPLLDLDRVETTDLLEFRRAVLAGLSCQPKSIPAKFLYDARGSALFDEICEQPEYYLTRTETGILEKRADDIARLAGPCVALVEFGSGSSVKSRLLLDAMPDLAVYAPIDISRQHLHGSAARLRRDYPVLPIEPVFGDYMALRVLPGIAQENRRLGFFPGSTIGNLEPEGATTFMRNARVLLGDDGALVLGADLRKDAQVLHDAYNDAAGVTAAFTLNLLARINRELDGSFDEKAFAHDASYNSDLGRIEIFFRSLCEQSVTVGGRRFDFTEGERVHTEYSYKYDVAGIEALARSGGFSVRDLWTDPDGLFAVAYLTAEG
jgi:dimethylhistidine N-methyltransferase